MKKYLNSVVNKFDTSSSGNAATGTTITVRVNGAGSKATIYSDNGVTEKPNPFTVDDNGNYEFYVDNGRYNIVQDENLPTQLTLSDVSIFDVVDFFGQTGIPAESFGIFGSSSANNLVDETSAIQSALESVAESGNTIVFNGGRHYEFGNITLNPTGAQSLSISAIGAEPAYFHRIKSVGDMISFVPNGDEITSVNITANISPNDKRISVDDTSSLEKGMVIQMSSDVEWPYDGRGIWFKGEIWVIDRVIDSTTIEIQGICYDSYDYIAETLTVKAFTPSRFFIENIEFIQYIPDTDTGVTCLKVDKCIDPLFNRVTVRDSSSQGIVIQKCVNANFNQVGMYNIGRNGSVGYGISVLSSLNTKIDGLYGHACRRPVDFNSMSGTNSSPSREGTVKNFFVSGGGIESFNDTEFYPFGAARHDGIGTHGPSENILFESGIISSVQTGVTVRGRNTRLRNIEFLGDVEECVGFSYGTGLDIQGCSVSANTVPDRDDLQSGITKTFLRIGGSGGDFGGVDYTLPLSLTSNVCVGLTESFIKFNSTSDAFNVYEYNNTVKPRPATGNTFYYLFAPQGPVNIATSTLMGGVTPDLLRLSGNGSIGVDSNISYGAPQSIDSPVRIADSSWSVRIEDDSVIRIRPSQFLPSSAVKVVISGSNVNEIGEFFIQPNSSTATTSGYLGADVEFSAVNLSGTTGTDGKITVHWSSSGTLEVENRRGGVRGFKVTIEG